MVREGLRVDRNARAEGYEVVLILLNPATQTQTSVVSVIHKMTAFVTLGCLNR